MVWGAPARTLEDNTTGERAGGELVAWGWGVWLAHRVANSFVDVVVGLLFKWRSCVSTTGDGSGGLKPAVLTPSEVLLCLLSLNNPERSEARRLSLF